MHKLALCTRRTASQCVVFNAEFTRRHPSFRINCRHFSKFHLRQQFLQSSLFVRESGDLLQQMSAGNIGRLRKPEHVIHFTGNYMEVRQRVIYFAVSCVGGPWMNVVTCVPEHLWMEWLQLKCVLGASTGCSNLYRITLEDACWCQVWTASCFRLPTLDKTDTGL